MEPRLEDDDLFEAISPEASPDAFQDGEEDDVGCGEGMASMGDDIGFEEISSEEDAYLSDGDGGIGMVDVDYDVADDSWNYMSSFDPFQCELSSLEYFRDPSLTPYEIKKKSGSSQAEDLPEEVEKVFESLSFFADKDHNEKWVAALENASVHLNTDSLVVIFGDKKHEAAANALLDWAEEGLDFKSALAQTQPAYKVRHMKAGIRLVTLLFLTGDDIISKLLDREIPGKLLQLFMAPYMSLPLKLQIVRALDAATYTRAGAMNLFTRKIAAPPDGQVQLDPASLSELLSDLYEVKKSEPMTGYQILLKLLFLKQSTRATVSLTALLKKLHLCDLLTKLCSTIDKVARSTRLRESKEKDAEGNEQVRTELDVARDDVGEEELNRVAVSLNLLCRTYKHACSEVAQPLRYLPARSRFEMPKMPFDPYPALFRMFKENHLLEMLCVLVSSPLTAPHTGIMKAVQDILAELSRTCSGMLFLLSDAGLANCLHRALLQDDVQDDNNGGVSHQVGMHLVYHLQALQFVDHLLAHHAKDNLKKELDDADVVSSLHHLYTMIFSDIGKVAVVRVLSMDRNLDALVPFLKVTGDPDFDPKLCKSVCSGYATELVLLTVHYSESAMLLQNYSDVLHELSQQESTPRLQELGLWMEPTRKLSSYNHEEVVHLMSCVKKCAERASTLPPELITALRILCHLGLPTDFRSGDSDDEEELKYKYVIMQIFAHDGLSLFLAILQRTSEEFLKPFRQSASLVGLQGALVVSMVTPIVGMLQFMLGYLISCRGTEFKDLTAVPVLLQTHTLMSMIPVSSSCHGQAQQVQVEIVETLLTYTQPYLGAAETEEALNRSLWTQMIHEVLKYTLRAPYTFVTGLRVLSELLPLPLPMQIREPLSKEDLEKVVNSRKLWSAHLHSLSADFQEIVGTLSYSTCPVVQQLFRRICIQLSDMASPSAAVTARSLLDVMYDYFAETTSPMSLPAPGSPGTFAPEEPKPVPVLAPVKPCSATGGTLGLFDHISYLTTHPPFKAALLHALKANKYSELFTHLLALMNLPTEELSHVHAQESILSILQSLCDPDIALVPVIDPAASVNETGHEAGDAAAEEKADVKESSMSKRLANSLLCRDQLLSLCTALLQHIGNPLHSFPSVLSATRILIMLTEHDIGLHCIKVSLDKEPTTLKSLLSRLSSSFVKDNPDYLSTLSTALDLLRALTTIEEDNPVACLRSLCLGTAQLAMALEWKGCGSEPQHPILQLEKLLTDCSNEEEALESLLGSITNEIEVLNKAIAVPDKVEKEMMEPVVPAQDSLTAQFAARVVFILGEVDEERLNPAFWLSSVVGDPEHIPDQVECDLASVMEQIVPDFNLKGELEKLSLSGEEDQDGKKAALTGKHKSQLMMGAEAAEPASKKPFIAPMRGRGFPNRGSMGHSTRANDPFRSRPPNTSRPPSMHVDDFLALESNHHPMPPGLIKRPSKDSIHGRGRGSGGGVGAFEVGHAIPSRASNRFFSPPGTAYARREPSRIERDFGTGGIFGLGGARHGSMVPRVIPAWGDGRSAPVLSRPIMSGNTGTGSGGVPRQIMGGVSGADGGLPADMSPFARGNMLDSGSPRSREVYGNPGVTGVGLATDGGRFSRGIRGQELVPSHAATHWIDPRAKAPDSRFIPTTSDGSVRGRRDTASMVGRHLRTFTR